MTRSITRNIAPIVATLAAAFLIAGCDSGAPSVDAAAHPSDGGASRSPCETTYSSSADFMAALEADAETESSASPESPELESSMESALAEMNAAVEKSFNSIPAGGQDAYLTAVCQDLQTGKYGIAETRDRLLAQPATMIGQGLAPCYAPEIYSTAGESENVKDTPDMINPDVLSTSTMMWYWGIRTLCPQQYGRG